MLNRGPVAIAFSVALLLAGCGKHYWHKPGAGLAEFSQDNRECAQQHAVHMSSDKSYGIVARDAYRACLMGRGWTRGQQPDPVPAGWFRGYESDDVVRLDAPPPQPEAAQASQADLPLCPRGALGAPPRDGQGRPICRY